MSTEEQSVENKGIESISQFFEDNKQNVMIAGIALILVAAGIYYYSNFYKPALETEAGDSFFMAERYYGQDSLTLSLNGDGMNLGMKDIADEYSGTKAGNQAAYYAGRILLEQGKFQDALDYLGDVSMEDEIMAAQILTLRGDCKSELEQYEDAADLYMNAANSRTNELTTPYALLKAGMAYEEAGEPGDALTAYEKLSADHSESQYAQKVDVRIAKAKAAKAAK
jgi:predicted negative regulator of RcsB-dependent stress response